MAKNSPLKETELVFGTKNIADYLSVLEILSGISDDFFFLYDIKNDKNWLFGDISRNYDLPESKDNTVPTSEIIRVVHEDDREKFCKHLECINNGTEKVFDMEFRWLNREGNVVWLSVRGQVTEDENGTPLFMVGRISEEALRHLYNPLTGLFNKIRMREDIKNNKFASKSGYVILFDIDDLAGINLNHGRSYGDEVLTKLAVTLENLPASYKVYHVEHNYFVAYVDVETEQDAEKIFDDVQLAMGDMCTIIAGVVPMNINMFVDETNLYDSLKLTLRKAKADKASNIAFFSTEELKQKIYAMNLLEEFKESVENNYEGFYLNYQPQMKGGSYELIGAEALIRYKSEKSGVVYPNDFIPLLEESRLINQVGLWVLETALTQCKKWRKHKPDFRVSVNFSTVQFADENIVGKVLGVLKKTDVPGDALTVEITESIKLDDIEHFKNVIRRFKNVGIQISIDDFGTGYSNIGYLKQLDIDEIKVDRVFVSGIEEDTYNYKIISNTVEFAKNNQLKVCCEGVEDTRELAVLEILSPSAFQGYLFHKPCGEEEFETNYINPDCNEYKERSEFIHNLYEYKEKIGVMRFDHKDILRKTDVGLWVIRINPEKQYCELYADETMERIMAVDKKYTPAECYDFWYSRVKDEYVDIVRKNVEYMIEAGKIVQLEYPWIHPDLGEVTVRCTGRRVEDSNGMIVLEGYHRIFSNIEEV